ncbi:alpha/beta fold hydrolase [Rhodococcus sp. BP-252]|uniref:alpha/beta fold hydrolase n=1 Tax=unclassified Rhodococcus (in: high G+C Gram-positive bacteria) TaxID=192944 RepID=UPI00142FA1CC|nr:MULTISPECIES: alpha/beta fold hydrolase [unclassified Rhodococcus (in: high G+C Gram-positive bacteria)]MBY6410817.1 alpha/beta fold hydrolase [Rhodococcus sp. BP-320]MBY6415358.1 alpha/beta fold hydrolase [Rhodococcus sp. BP-321]MBY6419973.1 alpha/beta fold hydrolase [Rhodococcus sp. BP-324]MBY6425373.1 alpha/beta fold hydrolase [Rhodococcus sp. BP-323]MBY6430564.1 alpha/beta fold hydrolase [Rhodococcus sp. BP-322]
MHNVRTGSGKPLVLVHGLGSSFRNWDPIVPALSAERQVIAVDLPGFGRTPPLPEVTIATLTDALREFLDAEGLSDADVVGSSMGARMVLELARRGHRGTVVSLDSGGFWNDTQVKVFGASITASVALVSRIQPLLPFVTGNAVTRTLALAQFSAAPWKLPQELVLRELRGFSDEASPSLSAARKALIHGPRQEGAPRGSLQGKVVIGWGRQDKVTLPSEAKVAMERFPDAELHWFDKCGHFPHWDQPEQTSALILRACA